MPSSPPISVDTETVISFIASIEGQDALLRAIALGFGHENPTLLIAAVRREFHGWSEERYRNARSKILTGQIDKIGGHGELKTAVSSLASALLGFRAPIGHRLEIGKVLFVILDADVGSLDAWQNDVLPILGPMGCNIDLLRQHVLASLPSPTVTLHVVSTPKPR